MDTFAPPSPDALETETFVPPAEGAAPTAFAPPSPGAILPDTKPAVSPWSGQPVDSPAALRRDPFGKPSLSTSTPPGTAENVLNKPIVPLPHVSAQDVQDAVDYVKQYASAGNAYSAGYEPTAEELAAPGSKSQKPSKTAEVLAGVQGVATGQAEALESPVGLAMVAGGGLPSWVHRIIGGVFASQMAAGVPEQAREAGRLSVEGTLKEMVESGGNLLITPVFVADLARGALKPGASARAPVETKETTDDKQNKLNNSALSRYDRSTQIPEEQAPKAQALTPEDLADLQKTLVQNQLSGPGAKLREEARGGELKGPDIEEVSGKAGEPVSGKETEVIPPKEEFMPPKAEAIEEAPTENKVTESVTPEPVRVDLEPEPQREPEQVTESVSASARAPGEVEPMQPKVTEATKGADAKVGASAGEPVGGKEAEAVAGNPMTETPRAVFKKGDAVTSERYGDGTVISDNGKRVRVDFGDGVKIGVDREQVALRGKSPTGRAPVETKSSAITASDAAEKLPQSAEAKAEQDKNVALQKKIDKIGIGTRRSKRFTAESSLLGHQDLLDWIHEVMPMRSKRSVLRSKGKEWWKQNSSLYDGAMPLQLPHHNVIYSDTGSMPDQVAQAAYEAGRLKSPDVNDLWDRIDAASKTRAKVYEQAANEQAILKQEHEQHLAWRKATKTGELRVHASELREGDVMEVDGERVRVTHLDADTGELTLEDGTKFGPERLESGESIYVEKMLNQTPDTAEFLNEEEAPKETKGTKTDLPKLRTMENQGDLMANQTEDFALAGERGTDAERIQRAKEKAVRDKAEAKALEEKQQTGLFEGRTSKQRKFEEQNPGALNNAKELGDSAFEVVERKRLGTYGKTERRFEVVGKTSGNGYFSNASRELMEERAKQFSEAVGRDAKKPSIEDKLDKLKIDTEGMTLQAFGLLPETWNTLIDLVKLGVKGGRAIKDAVAWAIEELKKKHPAAQFDEQAAAEHLLNGAEPNDWQTVKARRDQAETDLKEAIRVAGDPQARLDAGLSKEEAMNRKHLAAAKVRALRDQLMEAPDFARHLLEEHKRISEERRAATVEADKQQLQSELDGIEGILAKMPPKLVQAQYEALNGTTKVLPKFQGVRSLGDLADWLRGHDAGSPGLSWRERFNVVDKAVERFNQGKDLVTRAANKARATWEALKENYRHPPMDDNFRSLFKDWLFEKQHTGLETHRWVNEIRKAVPNKIRRAALSVWLDADGDIGTLRAQSTQVPERFRKIWEAALKLTPGEQAIARRVQADFAEKLHDAMNLGLVQKGRENYGVPQIWELLPEGHNEGDATFAQSDGKKGSARKATAKLDPRDPFFSLQRTHETYFDGIMAKGVPKSLDIGDLVGIYNHDFHNALSDRGMIWAMKDATAADGSPLVKISGAAHIVPQGEGRAYLVDSKARTEGDTTPDGRPYRSVDHWALRDWKFASKTPEGEPVMVRGDFLVHPDVYAKLKNELSPSWLRDAEGGGKIFNPLLNSAAFLKASKFASATFHMATIGEHALFHGVFPVTRGVDLNPNTNPKLGGLMRGGMDLGFGGQRELFEEGLSSHGGALSLVPGLGDGMKKLSDYLFQDYIPKMKAKTGLVVLERNTSRYQGKLTPEQINEVTAAQMNAAFGGQNWRLLGSNKTMLDVNRLFLTAPDFLLSRAKVVAQAFKPYHSEQRYFLLAQAAIVYTAARVLNSLLDDDAHWEPENAFSVVHNGRAYSARFLVQDIFGAVNDPATFAAGRLGPLPKAGFEMVTGRDMRTGARKEVWADTQNSALRAAQIGARDMLEWLPPVGMEGFLPGATGREQTGAGQLALQLVGVGSRKYTAQTQMMQLATKFNRNGDAAAQLHQKQRDDEARVESAYRKLDALMDAGDKRGAKQEYQALLLEGRKPQSIAAHYNNVRQPFTGNATREAQFRASLTEGQRATYQKAQQERQARQREFLKVVAGSSPGR